MAVHHHHYHQQQMLKIEQWATSPHTSILELLPSSFLQEFVRCCCWSWWTPVFSSGSNTLLEVVVEHTEAAAPFGNNALMSNTLIPHLVSKKFPLYCEIGYSKTCIRDLIPVHCDHSQHSWSNIWFWHHFIGWVTALTTHLSFRYCTTHISIY